MKLPSIHFYPGDWLRDNVAGCSLAAQGLWLRMMILMHDSERYGHLCLNGSPIPQESLARRCGCDSLAQFDALLAELDAATVPSRTNLGVIYSRRMVRDDKKRRDGASYGKRGGNPALVKPTLNPPLKGSPEDEDEKVSVSPSVGKGDGGKPKLCLIATPMRCDGFPEAWEDWIGYRAEKGEQLTSYTASSVMRQCERWGAAKAARLIRRAIKKSWKNILDDNELSGIDGKTPEKTAPARLMSPPAQDPKWLPIIRQIEAEMGCPAPDGAKIRGLYETLPNDGKSTLMGGFFGKRIATFLPQPKP